MFPWDCPHNFHSFCPPQVIVLMQISLIHHPEATHGNLQEIPGTRQNSSKNNFSAEG
jgi:hypothetical protein